MGSLTGHTQWTVLVILLSAVPVRAQGICDLGYFISDAGECLQCSTGTHWDEWDVCKQCPPGHSTLRLGALRAEECIPCELGFYLDPVSLVCVQCPTGYTTTQEAAEGLESCAVCDVAFMQNKRTGDCFPCIVKSGATRGLPGKSSCIGCPVGYYLDPNIAKCKACPQYTTTKNSNDKNCGSCEHGFFRLGGWETCTPCPASTTTRTPGATKISECRPCSPGYFLDTTSRRCRKCPFGTVSVGWAVSVDQCVLCTEGRYFKSTNSGGTSASCPKGTSSSTGAVHKEECFPCKAGTYAQSRQPGPCLMCPTGMTSPNGSTSVKQCDYCAEGMFLDNKTLTCEMCPEGTSTFIEITSLGECDSCPLSKYPNAESNIECIVCPTRQGTSKMDECHSCPEGYFLAKDLELGWPCVLCPEGTFSTAGAWKDIHCKPCAPGTFREMGQPGSCSSCPLGMSSAEGARTEGECFFCPRSSFLNASSVCTQCPDGSTTPREGATEEAACQPCPPSTYLDTEGDLGCSVCPNGTTSPKGSTGVQQCKPCQDGWFFQPHEVGGICVNCSQGQENVPQCELCATGTYLDISSSLCLDCPARTSTLGPGAIGRETCLRICKAGKYSNGTIGRCLPCPGGTFKSKRGPHSCSPCPDGMTSPAGATNQSLCFTSDCSPGDWWNSAAGQCEPCLVGFYKETQGPGPCVPCAVGTTPGEGTSDRTECYDPTLCQAGFEWSAELGECSGCGFGFYKPAPSSDPCTPCGAGLTTEQTESADPADCVAPPECAPGQTWDGTLGECTDCVIGFYKDAPGNGPCTNCGVGKTTNGAGSATLADCVNPDCQPGEEWTENQKQCTECKLGFYKSSPGIQQCAPCGNGQTTAGVGSTDPADCEAPQQCTAGQTYDEALIECTECLIGFYKDAPGNGPCSVCGVGKTTNGAGSTSLLDCINPDCQPGEEWTENQKQCTECKLGFYKSSPGIQQCTPCGNGQTTAGVGSTDPADCEGPQQCTSGQTYDEALAKCTDCLTGFYKDSPGNGPCTNCGVGKTTNGAGSASLADCINPDCQPGEEWTENQKQCTDCKIGFYKVSPGLQECTACTAGQTTSGTASIDPADCEGPPECSLGQTWNGTLGECTDCKLGFYKDVPGNGPCTECSVGKTTRRAGSTSATDCFALLPDPDCQAGEEWSEIPGECTPCKIGFYKSTRGLELCKACGNGQITGGTGSTSLADCENPQDCLSGETWDEFLNECIDCAVGFYKDAPGNEPCSNCGVGKTTNGAASSSLNDCINPDCQAGEEWTESQKECTPCKTGFYKTGTGNQPCTTCGNGQTTGGTGSTDPADCEAPQECTTGQEWDATRVECNECSIGFYKDVPGNTPCLQCDVGKTTNGAGSTDLADCIDPDCQPGEEWTEVKKECTPCKIGFYKPSPGIEPCTACSNGQTTGDPGSTDPADCEAPPDCLAGQEWNSQLGDCTDCRPGFYKAEVGNVLCDACPDGQTTSGEGSTRQLDCVAPPPCDAGEEWSSLQAECAPCLVGFYKTAPGTDPCEVCEAGKTTDGTGATSPADCVASGSCEAGSGWDAAAGQCSLCALGSYKPAPGTDPCTPCGQGLTTQREGATDTKECVDTAQLFLCEDGFQTIPKSSVCDGVFDCSDHSDESEQFANCQVTSEPGEPSTQSPVECGPGEEKATPQESCTQCLKGFYKALSGNERCTPCNNGETTATTGATDPEECFVAETGRPPTTTTPVVCGPGEEKVTPLDSCTQCLKGFFKVLSGNGPCTPCSDGETTATTGATDPQECFAEEPTIPTPVPCGPGEERVTPEDSCTQCLKGFYKVLSGDGPCNPCNIGETTTTTGSTDPQECFAVEPSAPTPFPCSPGEERATPEDSCTECLKGFYKVLSGDGPCIPCNNGETTTTTGSTDSQECFDPRVCEAGSEWNEDQDKCVLCQRGYFKPLSNSQSCTACIQGWTTTETGSTRADQCLDPRLCDAGSEWDDAQGQCVLCDRGYFKQISSTQPCTPCNEDWTTTEKGSRSSDQCFDPRVCDAGSEYDDDQGQCVLCERGYFKQVSGNQPCKPCKEGWTTTETGAISSDECLDPRVCDAGSEWDEDQAGCVLCERGYFKQVSSNQPCKACREGWTTTETGSESPDECLGKMCKVGIVYSRVYSKKYPHVCDMGSEWNEDQGQCGLCPLGYFKSFSSSQPCTPCNTGRTTSETGSTSRDLCLDPLQCEAGYEWDKSDEQCTPCEIGYYKSQASGRPCTGCSRGQTTIDTGSTSKNQCVASRECLAGSQWNVTAGQCMPCPLGFFKSWGGPEPCSPCDPGLTTTHTGTMDERECKATGTGDQECTEVLTETDGTFSSPGYDDQEPYGENLDLCWILQAQAPNRLFLSFTYMNVQDDGNCGLDYITVINSNGKTLKRHCGSELPGMFLSAGETLKVVFHSDGSSPKASLGFEAEFEQLNPVAFSERQLLLQEEEASCGDGYYIEQSKKCDGVKDCGNGWDETTQANCWETFVCEDGERIPDYLQCNGIANCQDASDESVKYAGCDAVDGFFFCADGEVAPTDSACNGFADCTDLSDEDPTYAGCKADPCASNPCKNGGICHDLQNNTFTCECLAGWMGFYCHEDDRNDCSGSPCKNGATCFDGLNEYYCACALGYYGTTCEIVTGSYAGTGSVHVITTGTDSNSCGSNTSPCRTLPYALARTPHKGTVSVSGQSQNSRNKRQISAHQLANSYWIGRSVKITGNKQNPPHVELYTILTATTRDTHINIEMRYLNVTGSIFIGDADLIVRDSTVDTVQIQQEYHRRWRIQTIGITLETCKVAESVLTTLPPMSQRPIQDPNLIYKSIDTLKVVIQKSILSNCLLNLTSVHSAVSVIESSFDGSSLANLGSYGLRVNSGFDVVPMSAAASGTNVTTTVQPGRVYLEATTFTNLKQKGEIDHGAAVIIANAGITVEVKNCTFAYNDRALDVELLGGSTSSIVVNSSYFENNHSNGSGGALRLIQHGSNTAFTVVYCHFLNNTSDNFHAFDLFNDDNVTLSQDAISKVSGSGGAIAVVVGDSTLKVVSMLNITKSTFVNNTARTYGGTLYISPGVNTIVLDSTFDNIDVPSDFRPEVGDIMESRGTMNVINSTFNVVTSPDDKPVLSYRAGTVSAFMQPNMVDIICPKGYIADPILTSLPSAGTKKIETLLMYCRSCNTGEYSLTVGEVLLSQTATNHISKMTNTTCLTCPYGAQCESDVRAKANFWGEVHQDQAYMYLCPENYCCQSAVCPTINTCNTNRKGILCGQCLPGYSESLFSAECIKNSLCTYASWFWLVIAVYGIIYVSLFIFQQECKQLVRNFTNWITGKLARCKNRFKKKHAGGEKSPLEDGQRTRHNSNISGGQQNTHNQLLQESQSDQEAKTKNKEDEDAGAYLSIFMYFIQIPSLLKINILYTPDPATGEQRTIPIDNLLNAIKSVFSFNTFGFDLNTCLFQGVTAVFKTWIISGFILYLFVILLIMYAIAKPLGMFVRKTRPNTCENSVPLNAKFLGALISLFLYTFQYFAENSFSLLQCASLKSTGRSVLFIDGEVECYQVWQYVVLIFVLVYVLPFAFVLMVGPTLLDRRLITARIFLISMVLPLFGLPYFLYLFFGKRHQDNKLKGESNMLLSEDKEQKKGSVFVILDIVAEPYRKDIFWGLCWEGMIAFRRLILVILATFISNILLRHTALLLGCFFCLVTHLTLSPFVLRSCNIFETLSLSVLLIISAMNLLKAGYFQAGEVPDEAADQVFLAYDWFEAIVLGVVPIIIVSFVILAIVMRSVALLGQACHKKRQGDRHSSQADYSHRDYLGRNYNSDNYPRSLPSTGNQTHRSRHYREPSLDSYQLYDRESRDAGHMRFNPREGWNQPMPYPQNTPSWHDSRVGAGRPYAEPPSYSQFPEPRPHNWDRDTPGDATGRSRSPRPYWGI